VPRRKPLLILTALVTLAVPATAQARGYDAHRVAGARVALGAVQSAVASTPAVRTAQAPTECANADIIPDAGNRDAVRAAILCLHNKVRAENGLPQLKANARLRRAAEGHSTDMVANRFFNHVTPSGTTMVDRILRTRYVRPDRGWILGENLEWGTGTLATPRGAVQAWLESPGHRANVLRRGYRDVGVGITLGVPTGDAAGATYAVEFGARR
jgi:uncharacterized protein YkwD